jgi:cell division GTPase FtsZ
MDESCDPSHDLITAIVKAFAGPVTLGTIPAVDIADYRSVFLESGTAVFASSEARGAPEQGRATQAADLAIAELKRKLGARYD